LGARDGVFISATRSGRGIDLGTRSDLLPAYRLLWQEITLIAFGVLVIGLVDNILRPIRVGKDTQIPDYVILISTLGGMVLFGLNGFVIGPVIAAIFIAAWISFLPPRKRQGFDERKFFRWSNSVCHILELHLPSDHPGKKTSAEQPSCCHGQF
jgi:hypothetical protein